MPADRSLVGWCSDAMQAGRLSGVSMSRDEWVDRAQQLYERAVFTGDADALETANRQLDGVEADLALARGRVLHARYLEHQDENPGELELFERATRLYRSLGDMRGEAEALFWAGTFHQVVRGDNETAVPDLERSYELATEAEDTLTMSYALRHLGIADHVAGRLAAARARLEESVNLRREIGFLPGVAANLVGLIYIALAQGRVDDARLLAEEASAIAESTGAHRISQQVSEARAGIAEA